MAAQKTDTKITIKPNLAIAEPPMFKVIYMNDDLTTMDFVVSSLVEHFNYTSDTAINITSGIHEKGSAVVAILPYEMAEQKGVEATQLARNNGFPLVIKLEIED